MSRLLTWLLLGFFMEGERGGGIGGGGDKARRRGVGFR